MGMLRKIFATQKPVIHLLISERIDKTEITVLNGEKIIAEIVVYCQDKDLEIKIINLLKLLK